MLLRRLGLPVLLLLARCDKGGTEVQDQKKGTMTFNVYVCFCFRTFPSICKALLFSFFLLLSLSLCPNIHNGSHQLGKEETICARCDCFNYHKNIIRANLNLKRCVWLDGWVTAVTRLLLLVVDVVGAIATYFTLHTYILSRLRGQRVHPCMYSMCVCVWKRYQSPTKSVYFNCM